MPSAHHPSRRGRRTGSEASSSHLKVLGSPAHDESKQTRPKIAHSQRCSTTLHASISIRSRITSILRRCSAIGCSPQGATQPATKARSGSCEPPWPQGPTTPRWPSRTRGSTNSSMPSMDDCSLATTSTASRFWNGRSPTRGYRDRTTRSPARRTPPISGNRSAAERYGAINPVITSNLSRWRYAAPAEPRWMAAPPPGAPSAAALLGAPPPYADPLGMLPACFAGVVLLCSAPLAALLHCANGYR